MMMSKRQETVGDGVKMTVSSSDAAGHDNISVGSNDSHTGDSGSDTPLLPSVERQRFGNTSVIVSCLNWCIVVRIVRLKNVFQFPLNTITQLSLYKDTNLIDLAFHKTD